MSGDNNALRTIRVVCTWRTEHEVEVPKDFKDTGYLEDFPADALAEMTTDTAELIDWEIR